MGPGLQYGTLLRKFVHTNLPRAGFEIGFLGLQTGVLAIEPPMLVAQFLPDQLFLLN